MNNNSSQIKNLSAKDFETVFDKNLSERVAAKINSYSFRYKEFSLAERDGIILRILKVLYGDLLKAGAHREGQWENGWAENLEALKKGKSNALVPRYFGKYDVCRWKQEFVSPASENFEYNMFAAIQDWIFDLYFADIQNIYEFGCGTGHNLMRAAEANPNAKLYGLDWAKSSQEILDIVSKNNDKISGIRFDIFNPNKDIKLVPESGVYTIAALEQIGSDFVPFVEYLIENKPKICVHIEPIGELLDENNLLDYLSIRYFEKRNYLSGLLNYLRIFQEKGRIKIHRAQRTYIGSLFIEGYSVIVWSPT